MYSQLLLFQKKIYYDGYFLSSGTATRNRISITIEGDATWYYSHLGDGKITDTGRGDLKATLILKR